MIHHNKHYSLDLSTLHQHASSCAHTPPSLTITFFTVPSINATFIPPTQQSGCARLHVGYQLFRSGDKRCSPFSLSPFLPLSLPPSLSSPLPSITLPQLSHRILISSLPPPFLITATMVLLSVGRRVRQGFGQQRPQPVGRRTRSRQQPPAITHLT